MDERDIFCYEKIKLYDFEAYAYFFDSSAHAEDLWWFHKILSVVQHHAAVFVSLIICGICKTFDLNK